VALVRQHQQVEILIRFDQCVDDEQRIVRRDVVVERNIASAAA
jgi:hypothetical protein